MQSILGLLNKNGSDKCRTHQYHYLYEELLYRYSVDYPIDILEVGIEMGGSLCAWKEYFPNAKVTGVDIKDTRHPEFIRDDVEFFECDIKDYKPDRKFDIIIEDGSHSNEDAIWAAINLSKHLKNGGTLVIEDVQEGFIVPVILWGKLNGDYALSAIDLRRITGRHDDFLIRIEKLEIVRK